MSARFSAFSLLMLPASMFSVLLRSTLGVCELTDLSASARTAILVFLTTRAGLLASALHRLTDDRGAARLRDRFIVLAMVVCIVFAQLMYLGADLTKSVSARCYLSAVLATNWDLACAESKLDEHLGHVHTYVCMPLLRSHKLVHIPIGAAWTNQAD